VFALLTYKTKTTMNEQNNRISGVNDVNRLVAHATAINAALSNGTIQDASEHEDYRESLAYDKTVTVAVLLSYGGPTDRLCFDYIDGERVRAYYTTTDNPQGELVEISLNDEHEAILADLYAVDSYMQN